MNGASWISQPTGAALGYAVAANLEVLVPSAAGGPGLDHFEEELFSAAIEVDDEIAEDTQRLVDQLPPLMWSIEAQDLVFQVADHLTVETLQEWTPVLRQPEDLYVIYSNDRDSLSSSAEAAAKRDLAILRIAPGLDETTFRFAVGHALLRTPQVRRIDHFLSQPRRFGEVRDFLQDSLPIGESADRKWQTLFRWLMYFRADRYSYSRPSHSEIISRRM